MLKLIENNRGFRYAVLLVLVQFLVMLVISMFRIGGEEFVLNMFNMPAPVYAGIATLTVFWGWKTSSNKEVSKRIWGWMFLGLFLWTIAELLWIYYTIQYQEAIPYPSPADFFWVVGNIPLLIALIFRMRSIQFRLDQRQVIILVAANAIFILFSTLFIFPPMFENADSARLLETAINVLYTVADLLLFGISLVIFFAMQHGRLSMVWSFILWSNIIRAIADLLFTYVSWNEATLSDNLIYIINYVYNIPYLTSYLLIALGMLANQIFIHNALDDGITIKSQNETPYCLALIFTNSQNKVIGASDNFAELAGVESIKELSGQQLHSVLDVDAQAIVNIVLECRQKGYVRNFPVEIRTTKHDQVQAWITATGDGNTANIFNGLNIVLRIKAEGLSLAELNEEFNAIAQRILTDTGQTSSENIAMLKEYFSSQVLGLYKLVCSLDGSPVAQTMMDGFNQTALINHWNIKFTEQDVNLPPDYKEEQLVEAFNQLFMTIKDYAVDLSSAQVVEDEVKKTERGLSSRAVQVANDFGLRNNSLK